MWRRRLRKKKWIKFGSSSAICCRYNFYTFANITWNYYHRPFISSHPRLLIFSYLQCGFSSSSPKTVDIQSISHGSTSWISITDIKLINQEQKWIDLHNINHFLLNIFVESCCRLCSGIKRLSVKGHLLCPNGVWQCIYFYCLIIFFFFENNFHFWHRDK